MLQNASAATTSLVSDTRIGPVHNAAIEHAARFIADRFMESTGAAGVVIFSDDGRLCKVGRLPDGEQPPAHPFMLATENAERERGAWRPGRSGWWLCLDPTTSSQMALYAHFPQRHDGSFGLALALADASLAALAAGLEVEQAANQRQAVFESALDRSELGIIVLGPDGALLFANSTAERLLDAGDYLRRKGESVSARDLADAIRLQVAIDHVCFGETDTPVVSLARRHPLRPLLVCVSPAAADGETGAVLRIIDPDRDMQPYLEPVCAHYRLSPVETRLACHLAKGATLDSAAAALRIKPQTARSYLKQIFLKTDTNRQSELVRMLLASTVRALPEGRFRIV